MSKTHQDQLKTIQRVLECNDVYAVVIHEIIEDYLEPDYSEMTDDDFEILILAAESLAAEVL